MTDPRYGHQIFSRDSLDYLQHSVISPKRIDPLEMKLERKAAPDIGYNEPELGSRGYLNGLKGSMR